MSRKKARTRKCTMCSFDLQAPLSHNGAAEGSVFFPEINEANHIFGGIVFRETIFISLQGLADGRTPAQFPLDLKTFGGGIILSMGGASVMQNLF